MSEALEAKLPNLPSGMRTMVNQHHRHYLGEDLPLTITILDPPAHGKVTTQIASVPNRSEDGNVRYRRMTQIFYQSEPHYVGEDKFTYRRVSPDPSDPKNAKTFTMRMRVTLQPQMTRIEASGPWRHKASGMLFPDTVADFRRTEINQFLSDGSNIGAGYDLLTPGREISVTVFSFPSPPLAQDSPLSRGEAASRFAAGIVQNMRRAMPTAILQESNLVHIVRNGARHEGHRACFARTAPKFFAREGEKVREETRIFSFIGGGWTLEYRFTYPADADVRAALDRFLDGLEWTHGSLN